MVKQTVFVVGATGNTGAPIVDALVQAGKFRVIAGARPSLATKPEYNNLEARGVEIRAIDLENWTVAQITKVLTGVDTVISVFSGFQLDLQKSLADASKAAGVKRFIPNDWGTACIPAVRVYLDQKLEIHDHVKSVGLGYTFIDVCWWMEPSLPIVDLSKAYLPEYADLSRTRFGSGNVKNALTDRRDIGNFVARIIADDHTLNHYVFAWTEELTQNEVFAIAERVSGHKFEIPSMSTEEVLKRSKEAPSRIERGILEYVYSIWIRGDNTVEKAKKEEYGGALDARELDPDIGQELTTLEELAKEYYGVKGE